MMNSGECDGRGKGRGVDSGGWGRRRSHEEVVSHGSFDTM